jgi:hypothetical protein
MKRRDSLALQLIVAATLILGTPVVGQADGIAWLNQVPGSSSVEVFYDFRPTISGQPNLITPDEEHAAAAALDLWSRAGNVSFIHNTSAPENGIINIGVAPIDGPWNVLGRGGYAYTNAGGMWHITGATVLLDAAENWDLTVGAGDTPGTVNFSTVAAHEIGHALGLDHTSNPQDLMYPYYTGAKISASSNDIAAIQALYGSGGIAVASSGGQALLSTPEPSTVILFGIGLLLFFFQVPQIARRLG